MSFKDDESNDVSNILSSSVEVVLVLESNRDVDNFVHDFSGVVGENSRGDHKSVKRLGESLFQVAELGLGAVWNLWASSDGVRDD